jgi:glycine hydroxymethyltransferase
MPVSHDPPLEVADPIVSDLIHREGRREHDTLRLIPSENYASRAVLEAVGSVLTNKYSEGYPGKRYYEGQQVIDPLETLACERIRGLFGAEHVNVQPYSGSPANLAVYLAFCEPHDPILGLGLPAGGHLTHGWKVSITGRYFASQAYGVTRDTQRIDFAEVRRKALEHRPKLLWCGTTAYPRQLEWDKFREIADECGALLCADMSHIAGLVAGGVHASPVGIADIVTSTTHKTLRGPRGGMILCRAEHRAAIDRAVFPGLQGGPHNHTTAGIAVAAHEAAQPAFEQYARTVVDNARVLGESLMRRGFRLVTGGTDNHLLLIDLSEQGVPGKLAARALDQAGIVVNYNSVPFDARPPLDPSGIRLGTPAITSRGMGPGEMDAVAALFARVLAAPEDAPLLERVASEVAELVQGFPAPGLAIV